MAAKTKPSTVLPSESKPVSASSADATPASTAAASGVAGEQSKGKKRAAPPPPQADAEEEDDAEGSGEVEQDTEKDDEEQDTGNSDPGPSSSKKARVDASGSGESEDEEEEDEEERYIGFPGSTATIAEIRDWCGKDGGMAEIGTRANGKVFGWEDVRMSHIQYVSPAANRIYMYFPDPKDDPDKGEFYGEERFGLYKKMQQWCETESSLLEVVVYRWMLQQHPNQTKKDTMLQAATENHARRRYIPLDPLD